MGFAVEIKKGELVFYSRFPWQLGIVLFMAYPSLQKSEDELEKALKFLTFDSFFDRLEINGFSEEGWKKIKAYGPQLKIARGFQPDILSGRSLCTLDEVKRRETVDYVKREIEVETRRGVREFALCSGQMPSDSKEGRRQLVASLKEIAEFAGRHNALISLETFDVDKDKRQLAGPIDESASIVREVRESFGNVYLMWDQSHAPLLGETHEVIRRHCDILGVVHVGCGLQTQEGLKDWHPVYHTKGALNDERDLADLFKVLLEIGYRGPVTAEVRPQEGQTSEEIVNSAKGAIYTAYSLLMKSHI
ncbi:MAG: sugar phosphate isomerase/epimerase family protein [Nitrososphaeria archaeon]